MSVEIIRACVRPVVTVGLVLAFCIAAFVDGDAAQAIAGMAGGAMGYWFGDRTNKNVGS